jgi:hypothetical protein
MAFTADWIAALLLPFVELEVAVCPRSSLIDCEVVLDKAELIELVPIPHLLGAGLDVRISGREPASYLIGRFGISLSRGKSRRP